MGMCGVNRIKSLADDLRLFDLFCPVCPTRFCALVVSPIPLSLGGYRVVVYWQFRSSNFSEETPDERALSFFG
jgi:hypothetical protein